MVDVDEVLIADDQQGDEQEKKPGRNGGRGAGFTITEDVATTRSFIATSENSIHGANMHSSVFKAAMVPNFEKIMQDLINKEKLAFDKSSDVTKATLQPYQSVFTACPGTSLFNRFKTFIQPRVSKMMSIVESTEMASGQDEAGHLAACAVLFKKRNPSLGDFESFKECYFLLRNCAKFTQFSNELKAKEEAKASTAPKRPVGTKQVRKDESDKRLVQTAIKEVMVINGVSDGSAAATTLDSGRKKEAFYSSCTNILGQVGMAYCDSLKRQQEAAFEASLDTPDKKKVKKMKLSIYLLEKENELRRLRAQCQDQELAGDADDSSSFDS